MFQLYSLTHYFIKGVRKLSKMAGAKLAAVPSVDIEEGVFKYILIKVYGKDESSNKNIVRGYADCQWHCKIWIISAYVYGSIISVITYMCMLILC